MMFAVVVVMGPWDLLVGAQVLAKILYVSKQECCFKKKGLYQSFDHTGQSAPASHSLAGSPPPMSVF